eukprot:TRINITY_DN11979_c0_g2_i1.p1 TRINITY_DN11979_c0_g2~~TRINITY_DN11979_c0_g2_i1.p1  ORF type:complete len:457 (-),score=80.64 TRINITY_DN11979_c0_g2_i1:259-1629(-)
MKFLKNNQKQRFFNFVYYSKQFFYCFKIFYFYRKILEFRLFTFYNQVGKTCSDWQRLELRTSLPCQDLFSKMKIVYVICVLLSLLVSANGQEDTIVSVASSVDDLSLLVEAVVAADLVDALNDTASELTVFAPTNAAFVSLLEVLGISKEELFADTELLTAVLTYHVVPVAARSEDLVNEQVLTTLNTDAVLQVLIEGDVISIDAVGSVAEVAIPNVPAGASIVHVIDTVLLPIEVSSPVETEEPASAPVVEVVVVEDEGLEEVSESVASVASGVPELSTLVEALVAANLVDILSDGSAPLTVFAPTNAAFESTLMDLGMTLEELVAEPGLLDEILLYHVVEGTFFSSDLFDGQQLTTLSFERELTVSIDVPTVQIRGLGSFAEVADADIPAGKAVVHIIDYVLLPFKMENLEEEIIQTAEPGFLDSLLDGVQDFFAGIGDFIFDLFGLGTGGKRR